MESPDNMGDKATTKHLLSPSKTSSTSNGLYYLILGQRGLRITFKTLQAIVKALGSSSQHEGKALTLKVILIYIMKHREVQLMPNYKLQALITIIHHTGSYSMLEKGTNPH